jgi:hypothetical protein
VIQIFEFLMFTTVKQFSKGGSNQPWNLSMLCPICHRKAQKGLLVPPALASKPVRQYRKKRRKLKSLWDW